MTGSTANGAALDTSSFGLKTFTVSATDLAGNVATVQVNYAIMVSTAGGVDPINADGSSIFKAGSTAPLKLTLMDGNGQPITNLTLRLYLSKLSSDVWGTESEAVSTSQADSGSTFRLVGDRYLFNLSTKTLSAGTWRLRIDLGNGAEMIAVFSVR